MRFNSRLLCSMRPTLSAMNQRKACWLYANTGSRMLTLAEVHGEASMTRVCVKWRVSFCVSWFVAVPGSVFAQQSSAISDQFAQVGAGNFFSCGITVSGGMVYCWGYDESKSLWAESSDASCAAAVSRPVSCRTSPTAVQIPKQIRSISVGGQRACGITTDGSAYCWGGSEGLGHSYTVLPNVFATVAVGYTRACALTAAGAAYCWSGGWDSIPRRVPGKHRFRSLAVGDVHTCGITIDLDVMCWGSDRFGELGIGKSGVQLEKPSSRVRADVLFSNVTVSNRHTCALTPVGVVYCWGDNRSGELGTASTAGSALPVRVHTDVKFKFLTAGDGFTCGLTTAGVAYCWGSNAYGELGRDSVSSRCGSEQFPCSNGPAVVSGKRDFRSLDAGNHHVCGVAMDGDTYCWGFNNYGQIGSAMPQLRTQNRVTVGH